MTTTPTTMTTLTLVMPIPASADDFKYLLGQLIDKALEAQLPAVEINDCLDEISIILQDVLDPPPF